MHRWGDLLPMLLPGNKRSMQPNERSYSDLLRFCVLTLGGTINSPPPDWGKSDAKLGKKGLHKTLNPEKDERARETLTPEKRQVG
jgi:hypothetical protein